MYWYMFLIISLIEGCWNGSYNNLLLEYARFWIYDENFTLVYGNY